MIVFSCFTLVPLQASVIQSWNSSSSEFTESASVRMELGCLHGSHTPSHLFWMFLWKFTKSWKTMTKNEYQSLGVFLNWAASELMDQQGHQPDACVSNRIPAGRHRSVFGSLEEGWDYSWKIFLQRTECSKQIRTLSGQGSGWESLGPNECEDYIVLLEARAQMFRAS